MLFEFNRFSSLLLIFFVHGLVYAFLLFRKSLLRETRSDKWLSLFLFLCILYITPWMVGFAGWYDNQPYRDILFYTPFQQLYFIGPVVFFYVQSLLNPSFRFGKREWLHLVPGLLYLLLSVVIVVTDKLVWKRYYFLDGQSDPDFDTWYQCTGLLSMIFYLVISLRYYLLYKRFIVQIVSYADTILFRWIRNFLIAFLVMLLLRVSSTFFAGYIPALNTYMQDWWFYLFFALVFYYIAITGYANSTETKIPFKPNLLGYKPVLLLNYNPASAADEPPAEEAEIIESTMADRELPSAELLVEWKSRLLHLLEKERIYEDPELSLTQVARQLKSNSSFISMVVNRGFDMNFNDFVNQYRVEAVKDFFRKGEHRRQTLLSIAFECGFNSKATFNRAFKKVTGQSPREYISRS